MYENRGRTAYGQIKSKRQVSLETTNAVGQWILKSFEKSEACAGCFTDYEDCDNQHH